MAFLDDLKNMFVPQMGNNSAIDPGTGLTQQQLALMRGNFLMDTGMRAYALGMQQTPEQRSRIAASFANNSMLDPARMAAMQNAGLENQIRKLQLNTLINEQKGYGNLGQALGVNPVTSSEGISAAANMPPTTTLPSGATASLPPVVPPGMSLGGPPAPTPTTPDTTYNIEGVPLNRNQLILLRNTYEASPKKATELLEFFAKENLKDKSTEVQRNYEYAKKDPEFANYQKDLRRASSQSINLNTGNAYEDLVGKEGAKLEAKRRDSYIKAGMESGRLFQSLNVLGELVSANPNMQGPIVGDIVKFYPGFSDAAGLWNSIVNFEAPKLRVEGSGSTSDIEYKGMLAVFPDFRNRQAANLAIIDMMKGKAQINMERAELTEQLQAREIDPKTYREKIKELNNRSLITDNIRKLLTPEDLKAIKEAGTKPEQKQSGSGGSDISRPLTLQDLEEREKRIQEDIDFLKNRED